MLLLQELLKDWPCTFTGKEFSIPVTGITENSKDVKAGFIFVARKGEKEDGAIYIMEAVQAGARVIVVDRAISFDIPLETPVVIVSDCRKFLSHASARLAGNPSERVTVIAVTGTNGKTTVSHFIGQLLHGLGIRTAVVGTLGVFIDGVKIAFTIPKMTTLPAEYLHPLLKECADQGVTHIVMEASSLGLSTSRLADCEIDIGVLLNIGVDHFDEHGGRESYIDAKKMIVKMAKHLVVNRDDQVCVDMIKEAVGKSVLFGTGIDSDIHLKVAGDKMSIRTRGEFAELNFPVIGDFNQMNALASIGVLQALSYELKEILPHVAKLQLPEGRMQKIERNGIKVVIDYAHTPDALAVVLESLVKICEGRVITVFGCGGNRDKGKRLEMGEVASYYSSGVIVTSDNPRDEDPLAIIADIMKGFNKKFAAIQVEPNRADAIEKAIKEAKAGDIVLIAGKGHEKTQQVGSEILPFSDATIAEKALLGVIRE